MYRGPIFAAGSVEVRVSVLLLPVELLSRRWTVISGLARPPREIRHYGVGVFRPLTKKIDTAGGARVRRGRFA